jgi:hypothetical protein
MSQASRINHSSTPEADLQDSPNSPTTPGVYWYQSESMFWAVKVEIRMTNGELMVWWLTRQDEPAAKLKGHWRGPIPPSAWPGSC